jgi:hypothetical protein
VAKTSSVQRYYAALCGLAIIACGLFGFTPAQAAPKTPRYDLVFELSLIPGESVAEASITLKQPRLLMHTASFNAPADRFSDFSGDGKIKRNGDHVTWKPPKKGGTIQYKVTINHKRSSSGFDALVEDDWALFRFDDVFPASRTAHNERARSKSILKLRLPPGWSVLTPFPLLDNGSFKVFNPRRRFDRPTGWVVAGHLGVRKDMIAGIEVAIGAPVEMGVQRIAMLALLRWTLPFINDELDELPSMISIVSAADPMWRGALSAPNSIYIHTERPLISENGTSTLLHEVMHMLMPVRTAADSDWIDEGLAEYLSLSILYETGTISDVRFQASIDKFRHRGAAISDLQTTRSSGELTARAVAVFYDLDKELRETTDGQVTLFDLTRRLMEEKQPVDLARIRMLATELTGQNPVKSLASDRVPGF